MSKNGVLSPPPLVYPKKVLKGRGLSMKPTVIKKIKAQLIDEMFKNDSYVRKHLSPIRKIHYIFYILRLYRF